jgi:pimeloyl-ACP methyl ester carboxylesterase
MLDHALQMAGRLFGPRARRDPDLVLSVLEMMLRTPPAGAAAAVRGRAKRPDYSALLGGLRVPSLVIAGEHDGYAPAEVVDQLVASLPAPDLVRIPNAGHLPNLERPDLFDAALRAFAGGLSVAG